MPETPRAQLLNNRGRVTTHVFTRLMRRDEEGDLAPMFRCQETDAERVYGSLRRDTPRSELEQFFGPLDRDLRAKVLTDRKAA